MRFDTANDDLFALQFFQYLRECFGIGAGKTHFVYDRERRVAAFAYQRHGGVCDRGCYRAHTGGVLRGHNNRDVQNRGGFAEQNDMGEKPFALVHRADKRLLHINNNKRGRGGIKQGRVAFHEKPGSFITKLGGSSPIIPHRAWYSTV